jgi:hypothetical protein
VVPDCAYEPALHHRLLIDQLELALRRRFVSNSANMSSTSREHLAAGALDVADLEESEDG